MDKLKPQSESTLIHDINSHFSALLGSLEVMTDEWRANPELVDRLLPLTKEKFIELEELLKDHRKIQR